LILAVLRVTTILTLISLLGSLPTVAGVTCPNVLVDPKKMDFPVTADWRKDSGDLFSAFRANSPHYWAYIRQIKPSLVKLRAASDIEGIGVGDFHILNFSDIELADRTRKFGLVDLDDGGKTSLLADFVRGVVGNQVSIYKVSLKDLWRAYLQGLLGNKMDPPDRLKKSLKRSHQDFLDLQRKHIHEITDKNHFNEKAGIESIDNLDPVSLSLYQSSINTIKSFLAPAKILDQGFRVKTGGGSQGVPRFWFLVEDNGEKAVIEFKLFAEPAMDLFEKQPDNSTRLHQLFKIYRPETHFGIYQVVQAGAHQFLARQRLKTFLDLDPANARSNKDIKDGQEIYIYLANRVGRWQAEQGQGDPLSAALKIDEAGAFAEFQGLVNNYILQMQKAQIN
jgi:hypothetical protein